MTLPQADPIVGVTSVGTIQLGGIRIVTFIAHPVRAGEIARSLGIPLKCPWCGAMQWGSLVCVRCGRYIWKETLRMAKAPPFGGGKAPAPPYGKKKTAAPIPSKKAPPRAPMC